MSGELGAHGEKRREQSHSNLGEEYCKWGLSLCKALEQDRIWCAVCSCTPEEHGRGPWLEQREKGGRALRTWAPAVREVGASGISGILVRVRGSCMEAGEPWEMEGAGSLGLNAHTFIFPWLKP